MDADNTVDGKAGLLNPEEDQPKVAAFLEAVVERAKVPGISVAMHVNGATLEAAAGTSNAQTRDEMTTGMCFEMGCLNKFLTAIVVLELVNEQVLELEQVVSHYLPELKGRNGNQIRIRNLLSHTAGYEDVRLEDPDIQQDYSYEAFAATFNERPMHAKPGSRFEYTHTASVLLGKVVEAVTGSRVRKTITEKFLMPLEIQIVEGGWIESGQCVGGHGLDVENATLVMPFPVNWCGFWEDSLGSGWIRMKDLVRIVESLSDDAVCSPNTRDLLSKTRGKTSESLPGTGSEHPFMDFGLGCGNYQDGSLGVCSTSAGQCSAVRFDFERRIIVAVGVNAEVPKLRDICANKLFDALII